MFYEYKCDQCEDVQELMRSVADRNAPVHCKCGSPARKIPSAFNWYFHRTHPDVKQDMHELVAGVPPSNFTEV